MRRTVTIELCIPAEESIERLRIAAGRSPERPQQLDNLPCAGRIQLRTTADMIEMDAVGRAEVFSAWRWSFSGVVGEQEGRAVIRGRLDYFPSGLYPVLVAVAATLVAALAIGAGLATGSGPVLDAGIMAMPAGVLCATALDLLSIQRTRQSFEAFLRVVFEGAIMSLTVSKAPTVPGDG